MTVSKLLKIKACYYLCELTNRCRLRRLHLRFYTQLHAIEDGY
jgi:hypothetical protein